MCPQRKKCIFLFYVLHVTGNIFGTLKLIIKQKFFQRMKFTFFRINLKESNNISKISMLIFHKHLFKRSTIAVESESLCAYEIIMKLLDKSY